MEEENEEDEKFEIHPNKDVIKRAPSIPTQDNGLV
uniref:Uncharacterized protein n=1 Tax=Vitis vinifera TaxID=29760 RepID=F6HES0_VITVI